MALDYSDLQIKVAAFLDRADLETQIPTFILMAEAAINRDVRHWQMEKRSEATFDERYEVLPTDWISAVRVSVGGDTQLDLLSQAKMLEYRENSANTAGKPLYYTISAGQIELYPTPDSEYQGSMIYMGKVPELSDAEPTNWLLTEAPDLYIYGTLIHSAPYLQEDSRTAIWAGLYNSAVNALNDASDEGLYSGTGLSMR